MKPVLVRWFNEIPPTLPGGSYEVYGYPAHKGSDYQCPEFLGWRPATVEEVRQLAMTGLVHWLGSPKNIQA